MSLGLVLASFLISSGSQAGAQTPGDGVVILKVTFEAAPGQAPRTDVGTGFFADHDGLIITADHVVNQYPPEASKFGSNPGPGQKAKKIEVFSPHLPNGKMVINVAEARLKIVTGRLKDGKWLDLAAFRLDIDPATRRRIKPLDIALDLPLAGQKFDAYGPRSNKPDNESELTPIFPPVSIISQVRGAKPYVVTGSGLKVGHSGGPLVNSSGKVVGICSYGERVGLGDDISQAYYLPIQFLSYLPELPPSTFFGAPNACDSAKDLPYLTHFDWRQISDKWKSAAVLTPGDCSCHCECLSKASSAMLYPKSFADGNCSPPFCEEKQLQARVNAVIFEVNMPEPDMGTIGALYTEAGKYYADVVGEKAGLPKEQIASVHRIFGNFLAGLATEPTTAALPIFHDASDYALQSYGRAQLLVEVPETYVEMAALWELKSKEDLAADAEVLADYSVARASEGQAAQERYRAQNIDTKRKRQVLLGSAIAAPAVFRTAVRPTIYTRSTAGTQ